MSDEWFSSFGTNGGYQSRDGVLNSVSALAVLGNQCVSLSGDCKICCLCCLHFRQNLVDANEK